MKTTTAMFALSLFLLLDSAPTAQASIIFITTDTTIDAINPTATGTVVGYSSNAEASSMTNPTSPTVKLEPGGSTGGSMGGPLIVYNDSVFTMTGGITEQVTLRNNATFSESAGTVGGFLNAEDNSVVNISGSGIVGNTLTAGGTSIVNVTGGSVGANLSAGSNGTVNFSGGSVGGDLNASGSGTINWSGGTVAGFSDSGFNDIVYDGDGGSVLNIYGTGLSFNYVGLGPPGNDVYALSGQLMDGTSLNGALVFLVNDSGDPQVNLFNAAVVPEPSSLTLMGLGVAGLAVSAWRRRKRMA